jgi:hypothetical protein
LRQLGLLVVGSSEDAMWDTMTASTSQALRN